jgi:hypothetical protein
MSSPPVPTVGPHLEERLERFFRATEVIWTGLWWMYLIGLLVVAYLFRDHLGWDDLIAALIATVIFVVGMMVITMLALGVLHAWQGTLVLALLGGFALQGWGCLIGVCLGGLTGLVAVFIEARPLREVARQRNRQRRVEAT